MGNWLTDKYAEGTIGRRFYAGCQNVDTVESVAVEHAKALFDAPYAYVQPHSGIDANLVAYWAILADRVEAPTLTKFAEAPGQRPDRRRVGRAARRVRQPADARHAPGRRRSPHPRLPPEHLRQDVRPAQLRRRPGHRPDRLRGAARARPREFKPLVIVGGYSAYPRKVNFRIMREIADEVGATFMVDMAHFAGLVAGKVFTGDFDPIPHAHIVTTTTHKSLRGPRGGAVFCQPELADQVDRGCPMVLGGPLAPRDGGQGDRLRRGPPPGVRRLRPAHRRQQPGARRRPAAARRHGWSAAAPTTTWCWSTYTRSA